MNIRESILEEIFATRSAEDMRGDPGCTVHDQQVNMMGWRSKKLSGAEKGGNIKLGEYYPFVCGLVGVKESKASGRFAQNVDRKDLLIYE